MKLEGDQIYRWLETVAGEAEKLVIVSPFFTTNREIKRLLESVGNLKIVVGDEFRTNNPKYLIELSELSSAKIRYVRRHTGALENRLHAKVFYAVEASERTRALVGSANFTVSGLMKNKEQSVSFDSKRAGDQPILDGLKQWINKLENRAEVIDWEWAKKEYKRNATPHFPTDDFDAYRAGQADAYWVLKTTRGSYGKSLWREFVRERVISIGWEEIVEIASNEGSTPPTQYTLDGLRAAAEEWAAGQQDPGSPAHAASMLYKFARKFSIGDRIIVCRGYGGRRSTDGWLYGLAVVDGEVVDHARSHWWRLKRRAVFRCEDRKIPTDVFVDALELGSLRYTIHQIDKDRYKEFCRQLKQL